jgi:hypothetical protein
MWPNALLYNILDTHADHSKRVNTEVARPGGRAAKSGGTDALLGVARDNSTRYAAERKKIEILPGN